MTDRDDVLGYQGKKAVVIGAASGMGEATARVLVDLGAEVTAIDVKPTAVPGSASLEVDLRNESSIDDAVLRLDGPVDAVFACAGLPGPPFSDLDVMLVNFVGTRHLLQSLAPKMAGGSAMAWVASAAGLGWQNQLGPLMELADTEGFAAGQAWVETHSALVGTGSYQFSKQAINAFVAAHAGWFYERGIRLNCSNPGPTATPMMPYFEESAGRALIDAALGPVGRYSTPEEQAWPLVFLNSPRSSYIAGESLFVDGGFFGALQTGKLDFSQLLGD